MVFIGSGKTTVAKLLAERLRLRFVSSDPIDLIRSLRLTHSKWNKFSQEVFPFLSYAMTSSLFRNFKSFVTDYDVVLNLAYVDDCEVFSKILSLTARLPRYDIVVILLVKDPLTVIDRALQRLRWGNCMLSAAWQRRYYNFTCRVLERFRRILWLVVQRGRVVLFIDAERCLEDVINDVLLNIKTLFLIK